MSNSPRGWLGILSGSPKCGKTHLALSASRDTNVFLFDTENGSEYIIDKHIDKKSNFKVHAIQISSWLEYKKKLEESMGKMKPNDLIVIDSFRDIITLGQDYKDEELKHSKKPFYWKSGQANKMLSTMLKFLLEVNVNVLITAGMKDIYKNDQFTGKRDVNLRDEFIHLADFIGVYRQELENWDFSVSRWKLHKQNWMIEPDPYSSSLYEVVKGLQNPVALEDDPVYGKEYKFRVNPKHR